jgi:Holliday junction resolvase RusA-like endonuclease
VKLDKKITPYYLIHVDKLLLFLNNVTMENILVNSNLNWEQMFINNEIIIKTNIEPVSLQSKPKTKNKFKKKMHNIFVQSPYIITNTCFISIEYYCNYYKRYKNHDSLDIDNIVKPILDSLDGLIIDDYLFDRVDINWIDKNDNNELVIKVYYPSGLVYGKKEDLLIFKNNNWCFPFFGANNNEIKGIIKKYFATWNKILLNNDYVALYKSLPLQRFISYNKINDKGYPFIVI